MVAAQWVAPELLDLVFLDANHGYEAVRPQAQEGVVTSWPRREGFPVGFKLTSIWFSFGLPVKGYSQQTGSIGGGHRDAPGQG